MRPAVWLFHLLSNLTYQVLVLLEAYENEFSIGLPPFAQKIPGHFLNGGSRTLNNARIDARLQMPSDYMLLSYCLLAICLILLLAVCVCILWRLLRRREQHFLSKSNTDEVVSKELSKDYLEEAISASSGSAESRSPEPVETCGFCFPQQATVSKEPHNTVCPYTATALSTAPFNTCNKNLPPIQPDHRPFKIICSPSQDKMFSSYPETKTSSRTLNNARIDARLQMPSDYMLLSYCLLAICLILLLAVCVCILWRLLRRREQHFLSKSNTDEVVSKELSKDYLEEAISASSGSAESRSPEPVETCGFCFPQQATVSKEPHNTVCPYTATALSTAPFNTCNKNLPPIQPDHRPFKIICSPSQDKMFSSYPETKTST
ncbi:tumor necrosis factor receptor superfamily member 13B [Bombina bombina]|uniref:tumor necrosis factor receptor superfamily member 13B n=1 Tax=Bombina bombina TaxID=8345 RepID=UPI00235AD1A0|nr:tumor necrosis factor receptor superfamily member 13B [Bombina bombina]